MKWGTAFLGSAGLSACGSGSPAEAVVPASSSTSSGSIPSRTSQGTGPDSPPVGAVAVPRGALQFTLQSANAAPDAPFCIGFAFRKGDIPSGRDVSASIPGVQAVAKNRWSDGSLKFAIVSGRAALAAGTPLTVTLQPSDPSTVPVLTTADLATTGLTAEIGCGSFGTATWSAGAWATPFLEWVSGPTMSSWIYRAPVGSDPHLVAWLEVRLWRGGVVEVLPWVENGYLNVAAPTSKSATFTFSLAGAQRFSAALDIPHHCRTVLLSGNDVSHWLGAAPGVTVKHGTDYLQATGLVPAYQSSIPASAGAVAKQPTGFVPFQPPAMNYPDAMGTGGWASQIGLLPEWDALYLSSAADLWKAVQWNHYGIGRYAIHYRDETTNRPLRFSSYPTLCLPYTVPDALMGMTHMGSSAAGTYTPAPSGTAPAGLWVDTHHPSSGFLPYLLTGRFYFLEEAQFAATVAYLRAGDTYRQGVKGVHDSKFEQARGFAFNFRALAQAATITPDGDAALRRDFLDSVKANIAHYHGVYVAQGNNPFGWIQGYLGGDDSAGDGKTFIRVFMQDYATAVVGYAKDLIQSHLDSATQTQFTAFFNWMAQSVVGRLGSAGSDQFLYRNAVPYNVALAPADAANFDTGAGPWYANWGQVYGATFSGSNPSTGQSGTPYGPDCPRVEGGDLVGGSFGDVSTGGGYWAYMQPALSYAVRHGVPGAADGWRRLVNAPNWYLQQAAYDTTPLWAVAPSAVPAWRYGQAVGEWREIPGSSMASTPPSYNPGPNEADRINAWNGLAIDTRRNRLWSLGNGGHGNYLGNEVLFLDLNSDAPRWVEVLAASAASQVASTSPAPVRYGDGRPASSHSYYAQQFIERHGRAVRVGSQALSLSGSTYWDVEAWDVGTPIGGNGWDPQYTYPQIQPVGSGATASTIGWACCKDPDTEAIYVFAHNSPMRRFQPRTDGTVGGTWATLGAAPTDPKCVGDLAAMAFDTRRQRILIGKGSPSYPYTANDAFFLFDVATASYTRVTLGGEALSALNAATTGVGMVYVPNADAYFVRLHGAGGAVIRIDAATWMTTFVATRGGESIPATANLDGSATPYAQYENVFTRWLFVPSLRGVVVYPEYRSNLWFLRLY